MRVIQTILFIILAYYLIRFIGRIVAPFVLKMFFNKVQKDFQNRQGGFNEPPRKKGDVKVEGQQKKNESKQNDDGEYVDFEEVD